MAVKAGWPLLIRFTFDEEGDGPFMSLAVGREGLVEELAPMSGSGRSNSY